MNKRLCVPLSVPRRGYGEGYYNRRFIVNCSITITNGFTLFPNTVENTLNNYFGFGLKQ